MKLLMTKDEFYEKYGDVKIKFSSYYKYTFTYGGELPDGGRVSVDYGGNSDDIYRFDVRADCVMGLQDASRTIGFHAGTAYDKDGNVIDEFYESYY